MDELMKLFSTATNAMKVTTMAGNMSGESLKDRLNPMQLFSNKTKKSTATNRKNNTPNGSGSGGSGSGNKSSQGKGK